ncbi:decaprenyl-phosphate phosphoribosyltransferase [Bacteroidia bacterium]|nr:decaprenyl-phosphate phosphoribosyltransferase [Bacteroidia bacterium]
MWNISLFVQCVVAFAAFSLAASAIYCFNDIYDAEVDRLHPKKCKRPIAAEKISVKTAYLIMAVCFLLSMSVIFVFCNETKFIVIALIAFYFMMNIAYCVKLKRYAIVDVIVISIGFVLRVLVGGQATGIWLSEWIIMMTFLLALFLAFAKRRDDVVLYQNTGVAPRRNTNRYNLDFMNQVMTIVATITIVAYIMYALSPDVTARFHSRHIYLTAIFVLMGIIRYLQITIVDLKSGSPTKILMRDRFIQFCIAGWIVSFLIIIYL